MRLVDIKLEVKSRVLTFTSGPRSRKINKSLPSLVPAPLEKPQLPANQTFGLENLSDLSVAWTTPGNLALQGNDYEGEFSAAQEALPQLERTLERDENCIYIKRSEAPDYHEGIVLSLASKPSNPNTIKHTSVKRKSTPQGESQSPESQDSMDILRTKIRKRSSEPTSNIDTRGNSRSNSADIISILSNSCSIADSSNIKIS